MNGPELSRREFARHSLGGAGALWLSQACAQAAGAEQAARRRPNVLFVMTDQQRFDTIAALGNRSIYTPNLDRLVARGVTFNNAYSQCPVCIPARDTIYTGCEPPTTRAFSNRRSRPVPGQAATLESRAGAFLPRSMHDLGYRTFGVGKFHGETLGFERQLYSEELYATPEARRRDDYAAWIAREHPAFDYIEALMGERSEMYYMPQVSPLPAELTVERWVADRVVEEVRRPDPRPYFGLVSFIGPHPPFAPPLPYNRLYDPDRLPNPVCGELAVDHMDENIPWSNHAIWADDVGPTRARLLTARYYGEITYIDDCIGRILDAVEAQGDADNTLICFFTDHGEMLGDHHAYQKESFFEASTHIPFLLSWPKELPRNVRRDELACLADLFGIATRAAGAIDKREGIDLLGVLAGTAQPRETLIGYHGEPGTPALKIMVRADAWKYIFCANGGREQLFSMQDDRQELHNRVSDQPAVARQLRQQAVAACRVPGATGAVAEGDLRSFPFARRELIRLYQFDRSRGVVGFPDRPEQALRNYRGAY